MASLSAIRVAARCQPAKQALIFLHGLGDSGSGWSFFAEFLQRDPAFQHTNFVFPNAPVLNITCNGNYPMPAWFDIREWEEIQSRPDVDGFMKSLDVVRRLVDEQVQNGIAPENVVVGGFSQGASLALASAVTLPTKIGAFVALSGFSIINNKLLEIQNSVNVDTPIFHGHGSADPVISLAMGQSAHRFYTERCGHSRYTMKVYPGMEHSTSPEEIADLVNFLRSSLNLGQ
ncbi:LAME_0G07580g1_1 [Lachancea meyersii CBS 8951]|uniref:Acyl-protein thioesterase 1 n=1 Tax=Lachancea meyersii CBS 8951 TaxID=1266667 RepID=A0A1G4K804_9SACH|nr:LAME_0G07580g1_1 [Lachancea meyersii CBS 8951]